MATTTTETTALVAFTLPSTPHSARMARFYVRAALAYHGLGDYAEDAETVTSELVTNAVTHAAAPVDRPRTDLAGRLQGTGHRRHRPLAAAPGQARPGEDTEHGRGLHIVEALSARWGWQPRRPRQGRLRDPHQGGMTDGGHLRPADAPRHRRRLLAPVRQARPDHPRQDRVRRVPARRPLPAAVLAHEHKVSMRVAWAALAMLAANRYLARPASFKPYHVTLGRRAQWGRRPDEYPRRGRDGSSILVTVHATLSAGPAHLMLSAREGPAPEPGATTSATARTPHPVRPDRREDRPHGRAAGMRRASAGTPTSRERPNEDCSNSSPIPTSRLGLYEPA